MFGRAGSRGRLTAPRTVSSEFVPMTVTTGMPASLAVSAHAKHVQRKLGGPGTGSGGHRFVQGECTVDWTLGGWSVHEDVLLKTELEKHARPAMQ